MLPNNTLKKTLNSYLTGSIALKFKAIEAHTHSIVTMMIRGTVDNY